MRYLRALALLATALVAPFGVTACANNKPVVLVAQTGQTLAGAIGEAARATSQLQQGGVLKVDQALVIQKALQRANERLAPLPDLLVAIDAAIAQGQPDAARIDAALAILAAVGVDVDDVIRGLPVGETASNVLKAVTEARRLQTQIMTILASRRGTAEARALLAPALAN